MLKRLRTGEGLSGKPAALLGALLLLIVTAAPALAQGVPVAMVDCVIGGTCIGTSGHDTITGSDQYDEIYALESDDLIDPGNDLEQDYDYVFVEIHTLDGSPDDDVVEECGARTIDLVREADVDGGWVRWLHGRSQHHAASESVVDVDLAAVEDGDEGEVGVPDPAHDGAIVVGDPRRPESLMAFQWFEAESRRVHVPAELRLEVLEPGPDAAVEPVEVPDRVALDGQRGALSFGHGHDSVRR
jgi:hypothetical protein